jgi:DNA-directed RNA polymerase subunit H (RpoH/RPB5)
MTTYAYTIELTDYTFIALENLLREECKKIEELHGIKAFDPVTGETKHAYGVILRIMQESKSNARLNSFYRPGRLE